MIINNHQNMNAPGEYLKKIFLHPNASSFTLTNLIYIPNAGIINIPQEKEFIQSLIDARKVIDKIGRYTLRTKLDDQTKYELLSQLYDDQKRKNFSISERSELLQLPGFSLQDKERFLLDVLKTRNETPYYELSNIAEFVASQNGKIKKFI